MVQIYLFVGPCFLQNLIVQGQRWPSVDQIHRCVDCICPELLGLQYCYVNDTLCHLILMRVFWNLLHSTDSPAHTELFEYAIVIFTPIVGLQTLKLPTWFIFNLGQLLLRHIEHIQCMLQEINSDLSAWIINKGHKIQMSLREKKLKPYHIRRYELTPIFLPSKSFSPLRNWLSSASRRCSLHRNLSR